MIPVTKPFLPPQEEYDILVAGIWHCNLLTNNGPLVRELEQKLIDYLRVNNLLYLSNGTIALQMAIKALDLKGEVITTPFSYVATASSIVWENCTPVFVDINPDTLNIDADKIESAITSKTTGIVATHVYGNPCDVDSIAQIAMRHKLKVIYDGAHAFGVQFNGKSIFNYGDISTASFHATKLFHTIEGGAVVTNDPVLSQQMSYMRNFGHAGPEKFSTLGINGKNSEFHAAMGLVNLNHIKAILDRRKLLHTHYDSVLNSFGFRTQTIDSKTVYNYSYYPVIFDSDAQLLKTMQALNKEEIFPRRYFYPSLANLPYVNKQSLPVVESISKRILCLPLYHTLETEAINRIAAIIKKSIQ